jgi:hypothetical protein
MSDDKTPFEKVMFELVPALTKYDDYTANMVRCVFCESRRQALLDAAKRIRDAKLPDWETSVFKTGWDKACEHNAKAIEKMVGDEL